MLSLPSRLGASILDGMCFLNEMAERFPDAISFALGRPTRVCLVSPTALNYCVNTLRQSWVGSTWGPRTHRGK